VTRAALPADPPELVQRSAVSLRRSYAQFFERADLGSNTRSAYARALRSFLGHAALKGAESLTAITPEQVGRYVQVLSKERSARTVRQHLAAVRTLFEWLVRKDLLEHNPAASVRPPRTPPQPPRTASLSVEDARRLLESIDVTTLTGLRDRAMISVMLFCCARVSGVIGMRVRDVQRVAGRRHMRLVERGVERSVPSHPKLTRHLNAYLRAAAIAADRDGPLFRTASPTRDRLSPDAMTRGTTLRMIKRRSVDAGLPAETCCRTLRVTGIVTFLDNGGSIESAQTMAAHGSPRTTLRYRPSRRKITPDEVRKISI
jgi:site-specific recombinase XerD